MFRGDHRPRPQPKEPFIDQITAWGCGLRLTVLLIALLPSLLSIHILLLVLACMMLLLHKVLIGHLIIHLCLRHARHMIVGSSIHRSETSAGTY